MTFWVLRHKHSATSMTNFSLRIIRCERVFYSKYQKVIIDLKPLGSKVRPVISKIVWCLLNLKFCHKKSHLSYNAKLDLCN